MRVTSAELKILKGIPLLYSALILKEAETAKSDQQAFWRDKGYVFRNKDAYKFKLYM